MIYIYNIFVNYSSSFSLILLMNERRTKKKKILFLSVISQIGKSFTFKDKHKGSVYGDFVKRILGGA